MLIGNEMDNIKGYELSGKNYIVHLLNCEKSSNSCIFRINGVNTRRLYSSEVKEDNLAKEFNIDGKYKLKINSVEFDYCGDIVYCNLQYEAFDRVNMIVEDTPCDLKDSDNGINYNVFGKILKNGTSIGVDNCKDGEFGPAMDSANGLWENYVNRNCQQQHKFYICPNGCKNGACVSDTPCDLKDSDNGINYNVFGKILKNGTSIGVDNCKDGEFGPAMDSANGLWENYVNRNCQQQHKFYICPNGCKNGACVSDTPCDLKDSDNGINYNVFGKILKNGTSIGVDNCKDGEFGPAMDSANGLWENYVNRNCQQQHKFYICPNGCKNGACVPPEQELNCNVIDVLDEGETRTYEASLKEYEVSALLVNSDEVKLIVNGELTDLLSESEAYLLKDDTKISIVDIKSQNVAGEVDRVEFCLRVFNECSDSDSGKNFYERGVTEYRKGENQYSNVEICTYTKAGPTTGEIGDSVIESWCEYGEYRVETIPCEFGCKSGACLKSPIELGGQCGDNICEGNECNTCVQDCGPAQCLPLPNECSGCETETTCLPFGTRLLDANVPKYCDITQILEAQKEIGKPCMNNYECSSNQCIDEVCSSLAEELAETRGLIERLLAWIRDLFGIEPPIELPLDETNTENDEIYLEPSGTFNYKLIFDNIENTEHSQQIVYYNPDENKFGLGRFTGSESIPLISSETEPINDENYICVGQDKDTRILQLKYIVTSQNGTDGTVVFRDINTGNSYAGNFDTETLSGSISAQNKNYKFKISANTPNAQISLDMDGDNDFTDNKQYCEFITESEKTINVGVLNNEPFVSIVSGFDYVAIKLRNNENGQLDLAESIDINGEEIHSEPGTVMNRTTIDEGQISLYNNPNGQDSLKIVYPSN